jgi:hypothetical protein
MWVNNAQGFNFGGVGSKLGWPKERTRIHMPIDFDIPVETPKQLATRVGVSEYRIKKLIEADQLEHILIVKRVHIPFGAWGRFIEANKRGGKSWQDETRAPSSDGLQSVKPTTSPGHLTVAAASARLALQTAKTLKTSLRNGCIPRDGEKAQVIPLKSS